MYHLSEKWDNDRSSWRAVIHLNLLRAVNAIIQALEAAMSGKVESARSSQSDYDSTFSPTTSGVSEDTSEPDVTTSPSTVSTSKPLPPLPLEFTVEHIMLRLRLSPLKAVEEDLKNLLGTAAEEVTELSLNGDVSSLVATPFDVPLKPRPPQEFAVRSHDSWRASVQSVTSTRQSTPISDNAADVIRALSDDIATLWQDGVIRELLERNKVDLGDSAE